jgi:hypothetical protein
MAMNSDKEKIRKKMMEIRTEEIERLSKINEIPDREQRNNAFDDFTMWRVHEQRVLLSEFEKWAWSE